MTLKEITKRLHFIKNKGFITSKRKGPTGIGHTLESELGLKENNLSIPDIGGYIELKSTRHNSKSMITLFTFNKAVWQLPQKEIIQNYGYLKSNRQSLYSTIFYTQYNPQKLKS